MKAKNTIWKRISVALILSVATTFGFLISCEKENIQPLQDNAIKSADEDEELFPKSDICSEIIQKDLLIGDRQKAGDVYIFNDAKYLYVHVSAGKFFLMKNAYLYVGSREEIPLTISGDLAFRRFNYVRLADNYTVAKRFRIPLSSLDGRVAVSLKVETKHEFGESSIANLNEAWADGKPFGINKFGRVFSYTRVNCLTNDPLVLDE